jgi:prepilin-type N-terminal cleavage/methylation domain-containing protein
MNRLKGYTLFELVLVTAIIGILFTFAIVSFLPEQEKLNYKKMTESLAQHIIYAQEVALTEKKYAVLTADPEARTYSLSVMASNVEESGRSIPLWYDNAFVNVVDLSSITTTLRFGDSNKILFKPWGLMESLDDITIEIDGMDLIVSGLTGHVSIQR